MIRAGTIAALLTVVLSAVPSGPVFADGTAPGEEARAVTLPSFTESPGCGGPYGVGGPFATHSGGLGPEEPVLGPWGGFFGRTMDEVHGHMVPVELPKADRPFTLYVHERVVPALQQVIANLEREAAQGRSYTIRAGFTSSYNPITIPGRRSLSFHTVGAAIDVNSDTNPYRADNVLVTDMPAWFVKAWTDAGWCWGGDWRDVKDPMHFSWRGPLYSPGYSEFVPYPPLTSASDFQTAVTFATALGQAPAGSIQLVADIDRDGAPDAVRLRAWTTYGHLGVEAAVGKRDYEACVLHDVTVRPPRGEAGFSLVDWLGDGRPDLWAFDTSGASVRVEVYRWETRYRQRAMIQPGISSTGVVALLAGDHDRDGRSDLYVVRSGSPASLEVWAGPRFTTLLTQAEIVTGVSAGDRVALGDHDVDGIPDLYLLSGGEPASLRVTLGGHGFSAEGPIQTMVGAHPGAVLQVADYDGDGRDDLMFFDAEGRVTVYPGGLRAPDADLTGWFSASFAADWEVGEGCVPNPGFETEPGFRGVRFADAPGPGAAFAYPNPETGAWTLAALDWSWWKPLSGRFVDLEPIGGPEGPAYAVLLAGRHARVELRRVQTGEVLAALAVPQRSSPVDLAVTAYRGSQALAVAFAGSRPGLLVVDVDGAVLADIDLAGWSPEYLAPAGDLTSDGNEELVVVGRNRDGAVGLRVVSISSGLVREARVAAGFEAEGIAVIPAGSGHGAAVAILLSRAAGRGGVALHDLATGARLALLPTARISAGVVEVAQAAEGPVLVIAYRSAANGRVRVEGRTAFSGTRLWSRSGSLGFDPADADQIEAGPVLITGHRFGDGNVEVAWWDPATGEPPG